MAEPLPRSPSLRLDGRRAFVTGAGTGIGLACAAALAEAGAAVTLVARGDSAIAAAAEQIRAAGGAADHRALDVQDTAAVRKALSGGECHDILINNAGTNRPKPITDVEEADFDAVIGLNLRAAFFVAQAFAARLIADGTSGSMIHMSSQMGHVGGTNRTLYCASKWGLEGLSKALALDLAPHGIRSNTIAPTFIETPMTRPFLEDAAFRTDTLHRIKLGRLGTVEDLMGAAVFLASEAAALITGTSIVVDGGWTAD